MTRFNLLFVLLLQTSWDQVQSLHPASLHFAVLADWGGLPLPPYFTPHQQEVAELLEDLSQTPGLDFILSLGDHFYLRGVQSVEDPRFQHTFEGVFSQRSLLDVPWFLIGGNHDHQGNVSAQIQYSHRSPRWNYLDLYYDLHFSVPLTNVSLSVLMIDTVVLCGDTDGRLPPHGPRDPPAAERQWAWISTKLAQSRSDYLLVAGHYPVWSTGNHGPTSCLVDRLRPLLKKYNVSAYLSGHDHNLQFIREDDGSSFVVSGSGLVSDPSMKNRDRVPGSWQWFSSPASHSVGGLVHFQVTEHNMMLSFMQTDRTCSYRAEIPRRPASS